MSWQVPQAVDIGGMTIREVLDGWQRYSQVLYTEDRQLFERMASDLNVEALEGLGLGKEPFELVVMTLLVQQQFMINWLLEQVESNSSGPT